MKAIEIINSAGGSMGKEISKLLPGVNLIRGLPGETRETFRMNYEFLLKVLDSGLILRRINIRQLKLSSWTGISRLHSFKDKNERMLDAAFRNYRGKIRRDVDMPMIKKVFPPGTIIPDIIVEMERGDWSIARPIGTYPIAVNIPEKLPTLKKISVFVVGYRERSLIGLPYPFHLKDATHQELRQIPGLSKKAGELMAKKKILKADLNSSPIFNKIKDFIR
jgi:radical SAM superfamily enzyme with C-terminal helix-hairpin-helix motif